VGVDEDEHIVERLAEENEIGEMKRGFRREDDKLGLADETVIAGRQDGPRVGVCVGGAQRGFVARGSWVVPLIR
jgi:hypothetical protein